MNYSVHTTKVRDFLISLSRNNSGQGTWQMGWRVKKIQWDGHLVVYKDSLMLRVQQNKFISETNKIKIGTVGSIKISKEFFNLSPGFYTAVGDEPLKRSKDSLTIRVYWNIMWRHAPNLMHMITEGLNKDRIPFTFKVLNSLENYPRSDAAVLYIQKEHFNITKKFLSGIYHALRTSLFPETSLFAKRIAKGLALAEDLGGNESFGQNRSRVLAEAMYSLNSETSIKSKLQDIKMHFQKFGFDLCSPYLNAGSVDDYDLEDDFRL